MIHTAPIPDLDIPKVNLLSYLFPEGEEPHDKPIWIDAADTSQSLSPKQMLQWVKRLIIGLQRLGLGKGDVCLIQTPNHILVPAAYLAIVGGEMSFSAVNPMYTVDEIAYQLENTGAKCLLSHPALLPNGVKAAAKAGLPKNRIFQFDWTEQKPRDGIEDFRSMLGSVDEAKNFRWKELSAEESQTTVATINYSSGTTGLPKGVKISHHALIANVEQTMAVRYPNLNIQKGEMPQNERWVGFLPLYHAYGQLYANLMAAKIHVPIFIMKMFVYEDFLRTVQDNKVTHLQVAPPILIMMSKRPETKQYDLSSIQEILCGGAPLSKSLQNEITKQFKCDVKNGWGMTEVTCGSIFQYEAMDNGTVGKLVPNHQMKLIDDDGNEVGFDTPGEIHIKAPNVMLGYWKNEKATAETLSSDGWLQTGDVGLVNKEGLIWLVDRKKELIKVNALQVSPAELEGKLLESDDIDDAAVVGVVLPDTECPRAYVVLSQKAKGKVSPEDIQKWFKSRVAKHKALTGGVQFIDEVPKLLSGKIQRKVLREWAKRDVDKVEKALAKAKL